MAFGPRQLNRERYMVSVAAENGAGGPSPTASDPPKNEDGHVSKSRRGLLAAGLAVAVAGSLGILSTMNADADQISDAPTAVTSPGDATDGDAAAADAPPADAVTPPDAHGVSTPPPRLPWGAKPERIKRGKPGSSGRALAAAGADAAAPSATDTSLVADPEFSPKGRTSEDDELTTTTTTVAPAPPVLGVKAGEPVPGKNPVRFIYSGAYQFADSAGTYGNLVIGNPKLDKIDFHTLSEIAVESADGNQIVEVGWTVDRGINKGDEQPHLFVYHWVDNKETCYNACGFVQYSKTVAPGFILPYPPVKQFAIQFFNNAWWVLYDSEWIGYFPADIWGGKFTRSGLVQWFGEVAAHVETPPDPLPVDPPWEPQKLCTSMGNGIDVKSAEAARFGSIQLIDGDIPQISVDFDSKQYPANKLSDRTFRFGGAAATTRKVDNVDVPC